MVDRFDRRLTPARPDLAARYLEGTIEAARFVDGEAWEAMDGIVPVCRDPYAGAMLETQALKGETVTIYDRNDDGWAWGQLGSDGYVGWLPNAGLRRPGPPPTHKVSALRTFIFPGPSIKLPPTETLPMGAQLAIAREADGFAVTDAGHHVPATHLRRVDSYETDFVAVAERFVGTPYLWGGRSSLGIDCSGLVQVALTACGIGCPRDSDMQQDGLGHTIPATEIGALRRGDLVFWRGHVAIARDATTLVHANAFHMATAVEPIRMAIARIALSGSPVTAIRRL